MIKKAPKMPCIAPSQPQNPRYLHASETISKIAGGLTKSAGRSCSLLILLPELPDRPCGRNVGVADCFHWVIPGSFSTSGGNRSRSVR